MSKQVQAQGLTGLIKKYLSRDNFAQYVTGLVIITFLVLLFWEFNNDAPDKFWIAIYVTIVITFLGLDVLFGVINIMKDRYVIINKNYESVVKTETLRREDPSLIQQMQKDLAELKNTVPSAEDLEYFKEGVTLAQIGIQLQQKESELLAIKEEVKDGQKELEELDEKLEKIS